MAGYKRKRGNSWQLIVTIGTDLYGKPNRFTKTVKCKSEAQADRELARFYAECESGRFNKSSSATVSDVAELYVKEHVNRHMKVSTRNGVNVALNKYILPVLGKQKVNKLTRVDIQQWINHISDQGISPKTVRNYYSALAGMMQFAIDMNIIEDTPCKNVRLPKKETTEADSYTLEEVSMLLRALESTSNDELSYKAGIYIALFAGLRRGEILGLDWNDINFDTGELSVTKTRMRANGVGAYEDTPKTLKSVRKVIVPMEVIDVLSELRNEQRKKKLILGSIYEDSPAVLQSSMGRPMYPDDFTDWYKRFCRKNNLRFIKIHGLRHTHASMLAHMGADKMQVSSRLGHSQLSTTLNIYTHLFEQADRTLADNLSTFLSTKCDTM